MSRAFTPLPVLAMLFMMPADSCAQTSRALIADAEKAQREGKLTTALEFANKAAHLAPDMADIYQLRGCIQFNLARFDHSIKDFDKYIELKPDRKSSHWQRGISYYYAGRYEDGQKQFEGYQTYDSNDVENAVWRFMCMAKSSGLAKAGKDMLKVGDDKRVPMRQVYDLFAGKMKPDDVLAAAKANNPTPEKLHQQLFYAHLYVGIYYDLSGDRKTAFTHLNKATEDYRIAHYMWDVARVHRDLLKK